MRRVLCALAALAAVAPAPAQSLAEKAFALERAAEVHAVVTARCGGCDWERKGREAAVLTVTLDGRDARDVMLVRGAEPAEYAVALGAAGPGSHTVRVALDRAASARGAGDVTIDDVRVLTIAEGDDAHLAAAHAPILHPRAAALRKFSDVPLLMWHETDATPRGRRLRYSVVFSNEDGGTPADRLMATWGRLTDIEFVYGVELDAAGNVLEELYQGREHKILPFRGRHEGRHPVLHVVTENNMLDETGGGARRYAPAAFAFDLGGVSREAVMDAHPWTYAVSAREARREGRVRAGARPGSGRLPDPRRFAYLEACAETKDAGLTFAVGVRGDGGRIAWQESSGGQPRFRIARSADHFPNGCFRGAVALPEGTRDEDVAGLRFRAYTRAPREGETAVPRGTARVVRVNRLFRLDPSYAMGRSLLAWSGELPLDVDGPPAEVPIRSGW